MVMRDGTVALNDQAFAHTCLAGSHHSEILYLVILVIKSAIYALYVVLVLIWLHLAFIVINSASPKQEGISI